MKGSGCPHCSKKFPHTKESVNISLVDRGLKLIGECNGASGKSTFSCLDNHIWSTTVSSVLSGSGCPVCAGNVKLTTSGVNNLLLNRDIKVDGIYYTGKRKTKFVCNMGHKWSALAESVLKGCGCPHCAGNFKLTKDIIEKKLLSRNITVVGEYVSVLAKTEFECSFGHKWVTTADSVVRRTGCPSCAKYGFYKNKHSVFYIYDIITDSELHFIGYGISNNLVSRNKQHQQNFTRSNSHGELLYVFDFNFGGDAHHIEKLITRELKHLHQSSGINGFIKEAIIYSKATLSLVLDIVNKQLLVAQTRADKA